MSDRSLLEELSEQKRCLLEQKQNDEKDEKEEEYEAREVTANQSTDNNDETVSGRRKKKRKRGEETVTEVKKQRKLRISGQSWTNRKGETRKAKKTGQQHPIKCRWKCFETFPLSERQNLFKDFYNLDLSSQHTFIANLRTEFTKKKRKRPTRGAKKRKKIFKERKSFQWVLDGKRICAQAVYVIFQISAGFLIDTDKMGKKKPQTLKNVGRSLNQDVKNVIREHIESFPKEFSHYHRKNIPDKSFIYHTLINSCADMYAQFKIKHQTNIALLEAVSEQYYRTMFRNEFNVGFKQPYGDTCSVCDQYPTKKDKTKKVYVRHQQFQKMARKAFVADTAKAVLYEKRKKEHAEEEKERKEIRESHGEEYKETLLEGRSLRVLCVDLGSVNYMPKLSTGDVFYKSQLSCYALYITDLGTKKCSIYTWNETTASRGAQEISSCLLKHFSLDTTVTDLTIWFDNCAGQNKSQINVAFFSYLMKEGSFESVTLRFLEKGHSFNPCDQNAGISEKKLKRFSVIQTEAKLYNIISNAQTREPKFSVVTMQQKDFLAWKQWGADRFKILQSPVENAGRFKISNVRTMWLTVHAPRVLNFLYTFLTNEPEKCFSFYPKHRTRASESSQKAPPRLYNGILKMKPKKAKSIIYLTRFLDKKNKQFYIDLCAGIAQGVVVDEIEEEDDDFLSQFDKYGSDEFQATMAKCSNPNEQTDGGEEGGDEEMLTE